MSAASRRIRSVARGASRAVVSGCFGAAVAALAASGCGAGVTSGSSAGGMGGAGATTTTAAAGAGGIGGAGGGAAGCGCTPGAHNERIFVMSDAAELWSYDTATAMFQMVAPADCGTGEGAFSMAVDRTGKAWILSVESMDLRTLDVNAPGSCGDPGYSPGQAGFGLFGMAFAGNGPDDDCVKLYAFSYSGKGPFSEGPGAGTLGVIDPGTATLSAIGPVDFDGGELSGTADGRLFAFTGALPAKLVEYDKATATSLFVTPLDGLEKTNASAFAIFRGDVYFFTEAPPSMCEPCLAQACGDLYSACEADPGCAQDLACALAQGDITDACGGAMPTELQNCLFGPCDGECFPPPEDKVSQVTRMSLAGGPATLGVVAQAPIRIVGAGVSTCVDDVPK